jgi:hypothetical protein
MILAPVMRGGWPRVASGRLATGGATKTSQPTLALSFQHSLESLHNSVGEPPTRSRGCRSTAMATGHVGRMVGQGSPRACRLCVIRESQDRKICMTRFTLRVIAYKRRRMSNSDPVIRKKRGSGSPRDGNDYLSGKEVYDSL